MFNDDSRRSKIVSAALRLAAAQGWSKTTLQDIAAAADLSFAQLVQEFESKTAILQAFRRETDVEVLKRLDAEEPQGTPREKLFDVVMTRFDVLQPHKLALKNIRRDLRSNPVGSAPPACGSLQSLALMLEASGIRVSGADGCIKVSGLACALRPVAETWLDDGPDNSRTLAALDRNLRRAEKQWNRYDAFRSGICNLACAFAPGRRRDETEAPPPPVAPAPATNGGGATPGPAPA